jgi:hypothetical protein
MSKTKVHTLTDIENKKLSISKTDYVAMMDRIVELQDELNRKAEEEDVKEYEIMILKNEIKNLVVLCKSYKNEIKNKDDAENALKKSL